MNVRATVQFAKQFTEGIAAILAAVGSIAYAAGGMSAAKPKKRRDGPAE